MAILIVAAFLVIPFGIVRSRRLLRQSVVVIAFAVLSRIFTGCGQTAIPFHLVPQGTYQVPILATDASGNGKYAILTVVIQP